ncbi:MAG TPA: hypothetical protein PKJ33_04205 [Alphaproteobacteria bacterium]|nr:hypothetical protein [Alphaproteobacteria bacterium]
MNNVKKFKKPAAALELFTKDFTVYISTLVIDEFGVSYQTSSELKNTWRKTFKPSIEIADFLILKTKSYIRLLNHEDAKNPQFLESLTSYISDYLACYFTKIKNSELYSILKISKEFKKPIHRDFISEELHKIFYYNFSYIKNLLDNIEKNKNNKRFNKEKRHTRQPEANNTKVVKIKPELARAIQTFDSVTGEKVRYSMVCKTRYSY